MNRQESAKAAGGIKLRTIACGHTIMCGPATKACEECKKKQPEMPEMRGILSVDGKDYRVIVTLQLIKGGL